MLRAFQREGVEFLIIGSMAKSRYWRVPVVNDMDLMIAPTIENAIKVQSAFSVVRCTLSLPVMGVDSEYFIHKVGQGTPLQVNLREFDINAEFLTPKPEFDFCEAFSRSILEVVDGIKAQIVSEYDLGFLDCLAGRSNKKVEVVDGIKAQIVSEYDLGFLDCLAGRSNKKSDKGY